MRRLLVLVAALGLSGCPISFGTSTSSDPAAQGAYGPPRTDPPPPQRDLDFYSEEAHRASHAAVREACITECIADRSGELRAGCAKTCGGR